MICFFGKLLMLSVMLSLSEFVEIVLILMMFLFELSFMMEFLLNECLICESVVLRVLFLFIDLFFISCKEFCVMGLFLGY